MKLFKFAFTALLISIFLIACASYRPPIKYDFQTEMIYKESFDEIWNKTVEWFATQGTPIKNMDKESGFISTEYSLSTEKHMRYVDCGIVGEHPLVIQKIENPTGNFNILIKKQPDDKTSVNINSFFQATYIATTGSGIPASKKIECVSTGLLEREIFEYLGTD